MANLSKLTDSDLIEFVQDSLDNGDLKKSRNGLNEMVMRDLISAEDADAHLDILEDSE